MSADRPQYGEYATPEEQRRAAGLPPESVAPEPVPSPAPVPPMATAGGFGTPTTARHPGDRIAVFVMLGIGLVYVLSAVPGYFALAETFNQALPLLGIEGEFTNVAGAKLWGPIAAIVMVVGFALTAFLAIRRVNRGGLSWWIPVVGCVVTMFLVGICSTVPMFGDPVFLQGLSPS